VTTLLLVAHGLNESLRRTVFGGTADLDPSALRAASLLVASGNLVLSGPAPPCVQTASVFGTPVIEPDLADCDYGSWTGRELGEISSEDLHRWRTDPDSTPHGGESRTELVRRVGTWLGTMADPDRRTVLAVTHAAVVRAAVMHALDSAAFWRIDVEPLSVTRLRTGPRGWTLVLSS
jgi:broad specificity phosphatase PhoE